MFIQKKDKKRPFLSVILDRRLINRRPNFFSPDNREALQSARYSAYDLQNKRNFRVRELVGPVELQGKGIKKACKKR